MDILELREREAPIKYRYGEYSGGFILLTLKRHTERELKRAADAAEERLLAD